MSETLAIATPAYLSQLVRAAAPSTITRKASLTLADRNPDVLAKAGVSPAQCFVVMAAIAAAGLLCAVAPDVSRPAMTIAASCLFLAALLSAHVRWGGELRTRLGRP
jgi:hypothetical protein